MTARLSVVARPDLAPVLVADRDLPAVLPDLARALGRHGLVTVAKTAAVAEHGAADAPASVAPPDAPEAARAAHRSAARASICRRPRPPSCSGLADRGRGRRQPLTTTTTPPPSSCRTGRRGRRTTQEPSDA